MFKIRGEYETSSVEKVNDLMKHFKKIRDADPIVALQRFLELDIGMCGKNTVSVYPQSAISFRNLERH